MEYRPSTARSLAARQRPPQIHWGAAGSSTQQAIPQAQLTSYQTSFAIIGDFGCNCTGEQDVANLVKSWGVDFVVTTGDNSYPDSSAAYLDKNVGQYYREFIHPYHGTYGAGSPTGTNRFFPVMGNHDWDGGSSGHYLSYFTLPGNERYYEMRAGPVHLFALDSDSREPHGISSTSTQAQWLQSRMSASTATWQIPVMHHSPYGSGGGVSATMRWPYKNWGADAVVAGHAHVYERIETGGLTYMVNGLGGAAKHSFGTPVSGSQVRYAADVGAMLVQANSQAITFQFINRAGAVIDTKTLNAPPPPPVDVVVVRPTESGSGGGWSGAGTSTLPLHGRPSPPDEGQVTLGSGLEAADGGPAAGPAPSAPPLVSAVPQTIATGSGAEAAPHRLEPTPSVQTLSAPALVQTAVPTSRPSLDPDFEMEVMATTPL